MMSPDELRALAARIQPQIISLTLQLQLDADLAAILMKLVIEDVAFVVARNQERKEI